MVRNFPASHESKVLGLHLPGMPSTTQFNMAEAIEVLTRTPRNLKRAAARAARGLGAVQRRKRYLERVRHRGSLELRRAHRLDAAGADHSGEPATREPFDPFDRFAQLKESQDKSMEQLLDDSRPLAKENPTALQALNLQPRRPDTERKASGAGSGDAIENFWRHGRFTTSLMFINCPDVMAHQYRDAVGPWSAYLGSAAVCWS